MKMTTAAISVFLVLTSANVLSQTHAAGDYFDKDWNALPSKENAVYYRRVEERDGKFMVRDYYAKSDSLQMEAWCSQVKPGVVLDGEGVWYYRC